MIAQRIGVTPFSIHIHGMLGQRHHAGLAEKAVRRKRQAQHPHVFEKPDGNIPNSWDATNSAHPAPGESGFDKTRSPTGRASPHPGVRRLFRRHPALINDVPGIERAQGSHLGLYFGIIFGQFRMLVQEQGQGTARADGQIGDLRFVKHLAEPVKRAPPVTGAPHGPRPS